MVPLDSGAVTTPTYLETGDKFDRVINPNEQWSGDDYLFRTTDANNADFLTKYPGITVDNLRSIGVVSIPGKAHLLVDMEHPVIEMLEVNKEQLQVDMSNVVDVSIRRPCPIGPFPGNDRM